jgi:Protein of unknown function (DUF3175)
MARERRVPGLPSATLPERGGSRGAAEEPIGPVTVLGKMTGMMEPVMAEDRKTARSRKPPTRKTARKNTRKTTARKTSSARRKTAGKTSTKKTSVKASSKRWSQRVTQESDALDLKRGVFTQTDPKKIAASLKRSAEHSSRRKAGAYRSALSMLTFYINRAGKTLPKPQRDRLQRAKTELKHQFHRE